MRRLLCVIFIYIFNSLHTVPSHTLEIGEPCVNTNYDGKPGVCIADSDCKWVIEKLTKREINHGQITPCGSYDGNFPTICCPSERKCVQKCKEYQALRFTVPQFNIIGGLRTEVGEFPHMAAIGINNTLDNVIDFNKCAGSLISDKFVLTAAHCVNIKHLVPSDVRLGRTSLMEDEEDQNPIIEIPVKRFIIHPNYSTITKYNDIALLELEKSVENFTELVRPACLHTIDNDKDKTQLLISGWGRTSSTKSDDRSKWLLKAKVTEEGLQECREKVRIATEKSQVTAFKGGIEKTQICAIGNSNGTIADACQGDSGGPLQWYKDMNYNKYYYIYGIVSFGLSCGQDFPAFYTRVSSYLDWIEPIVWP